MNLWPHQKQGLADFWRLVERGEKKICITSPTGGGKTKIGQELLHECVARGWRAVWYTNRTLLLEQTSRMFENVAIPHGLRAAGHEPSLKRDIQISMVPTEASRTIKGNKTGTSWSMHDADLVLVDEAHNNVRGVIVKLLNKHLGDGAVVCLLTATPVGVETFADHLVVAGRNSDLMACGAHVKCESFCCGQIDTRKVGRIKDGEYDPNQLAGMMLQYAIVGNIVKNYFSLNQGEPAILFAPSVPSSVALCEQLNAAGISAAHIDGGSVIWGGREYDRRGSNVVDELAEAHKTGELQVVCNRFVLREGIDWPWVGHMIAATKFGSVKTYLQAGGRGLRAAPGKNRTIWQDHGGSLWDFGSLNRDREWVLGKKLRDYETEIRREYQTGQKPEPISCPECGRVRPGGRVCPHCGHAHVRSVRHVLQLNGELKRVTGSVHKKVRPVDDVKKAWIGCYYAIKNARSIMNFNQLRGHFERKHPRYEVRFQSGKTIAYDKLTMETTVLSHVPPPGSTEWSQSVRHTSWDCLQMGDRR